MMLPAAPRGWSVQKALMSLLHDASTKPQHAKRIREALRLAAEALEEKYGAETVS